MNYYLLVYDRAAAQLMRDVEEFSQAERHVALERRFDLERQEREHDEVEVVLLGAESRDALMRTHARYFKTVAELATGAHSQ